VTAVCGRVADEKLGVAAIDAQDFKALVPGLIADLSKFTPRFTAVVTRFARC
jgi:hypothetical protein